MILDRMKRFSLMALLVSAIALSLSACGGDAATATVPPAPSATTAAAADTPTAVMAGETPTTGATGAEQEVKVELKEFSITPAQISVSAGKVKFVVTNVGSVSHNFTITGDSGVLAATTTFPASDSPQTFELDLKPGTYQTLCTVPGHAQHGQTGTLVVK